MVRHSISGAQAIAGMAIVMTVLLVAFVPTRIAHADSPFNDPTFHTPQGGGTGSLGVGAPVAALPAIPLGYQELPLPTIRRYAPRASPFPAPLAQDQVADPNNPLGYLSLVLQPGKWAAETMLGGLSMMVNSVSAIFQAVATTAFAAIFKTPRALTVDWIGDGSFGTPRAAADVVANAVFAIMLIIFVYRGIRLLTAYHREEAIDLAFATIGGIIATKSAWWFCGVMIDASNVIIDEMVRSAFGEGLPILPFAGPSGVPLSLVLALATLYYWIMLTLLAIHAFRRIILINLMLMVSPLAGLAIMTGGAWNYARVWFFRFVELLITPIIWVATLAFGRAIMTAIIANPIGVGVALGGPVTQGVISAVLLGAVYYLVMQAPHYVGIAAREAIQSGAGKRVVMTVMSVASRFI